MAVVHVPELEGWSLEEIVFVRLPDGSLVGSQGDVPEIALERFAAGLEGSVEHPYEARAVRRGTHEWSVAARAARLDLIALPESLEAEEVMFAVGPDGSTTLLVDGEEPEVVTPELEATIAELEQHGSARASAFVVRAERIGPGRWLLTVDPL